MELLKTIIKIQFADEGYLPGAPYHLISDKEMYHAFLNDDGDPCWFYDKYPCYAAELTDKYNLLVENIKYHIQKDLDSSGTSWIPDWVVSYMMGSVISDASREDDRHQLFVMLNLDNLTDTFNASIGNSIYETSLKWILKLPQKAQDHRPPTIFGEPHVMKSLRLAETQLTN